MRSRLKVVGIVFLCVGLLYAAATAGLYAAMRQPPERFGAIMAHVPTVAMIVLPFKPLWMAARRGELREGDNAPDFLLPAFDHKRIVRLSDEYSERPVVLVFGSYSWPPFRREVPALNKLYQTYGDRVRFFVVYIQEAHPSDLWQMDSNVRAGVVFASPRSDEERTSTATACVRNLGIQMPALLDGIENVIERAYTGWPDRIYLIEKGGRVVFKSDPGPFGFSTSRLEAALKGIRLDP